MLRAKEAKPDTEKAFNWYSFNFPVKNKLECYEKTIFTISFYYLFFFFKPDTMDIVDLYLSAAAEFLQNLENFF